MSPKNKRQDFEFTPTVVIRLILFFVLIAFAIWYFSSRLSPSGPNRLAIFDKFLNQTMNQLYQKIPPSNPIFSAGQEKFKYFQRQLKDFPALQIAKLKKSLIQNIAKDLLNNLE